MVMDGKYLNHTRSLREGFKKKIKKNYGKFHIRGGGGGQQGTFSIANFFFIFFAPNGLKIIYIYIYIYIS